MSTLKSFRFHDALLSRIEEIAKSKRVKFATAWRLATERGVAAIERDAAPEAARVPDAAKRKVLSRGVY